jgi:hypothetical protein
LIDRLRAAWSLAALVPAFDPRGLRAREWRSAGVLTLAVHALMLVTIVGIGKFALNTLGPEPDHARVIDFKSHDVRPDDPARHGDDGGGKTTEADPNPGTGSEGGNVAPKPVTRGELPRQTPNPPMVLPNLPTAVNPNLPVEPTIQGPQIDVPVPAQIGVPTAPPGPDESPGSNGGLSIGNGSDGPGGDGGKGATPGVGPRDGRDRRNGTVPGPGPNILGHDVAPGTPDHGVRIIRKARAVPTKAMIENGTFGSITLTVTVGADGSIQSVVPVQTLENGGTKAAIDAVYRCKFEPAVRNGQYVTASTQVRVDVKQF